MKQQIETALNEHLSVMTALKGASGAIEAVAMALVASYRRGGKLLIFGNGGSAADAQHIAAELVGRFETERKGLAAIALTTDSSALTAIANDFGYDRIFSRQVEALGRPGDVVIGISTSGNSGNVIQGLECAKEAGCVTVALTGRDGGKLGGMADHHVNVPHDNTARVQEGHITLGHILCQLVEAGLAEAP